MDFEPRTYRGSMNMERFRFFNTVNKETDLWIGISPMSFHHDMPAFCEDKVRIYRNEIDSCIKRYPRFGSSLKPIPVKKNVPAIAMEMINAAKYAGTGPMAAVAGAFAEAVGNDIIKKYNPEEVVIENGGDIFVCIKNDLLVQFFAGKNHYFSKLALKIPGEYGSLGICTSSGMFGHSFSYGLADSVTVVSTSTPQADALATSICNKVKVKEDIKALTSKYQNDPGILSLVIIKDEEMGIAGEFTLKML